MDVWSFLGRGASKSEDTKPPLGDKNACAGWPSPRGHGGNCEAVWNICTLERLQGQWLGPPVTGLHLSSRADARVCWTLVVSSDEHCWSAQQRRTLKLPGMLQSLVFAQQISDHLDIGRDESDVSKIASLSAIHAVGDPLYVKVREACAAYPSLSRQLPSLASMLANLFPKPSKSLLTDAGLPPRLMRSPESCRPVWSPPVDIYSHGESG